MFIDTHCHLNKKYYDNLEEIIEEMKNNLMIVSGCNDITNKEVIELVNKYPNIYGSIGIHPEDTAEMTENSYQYIIDNIKNPKIVAIGEIGLDYYYRKDNKEIQKEVFRKQIDIAIKYNKAIVVHSREAINDTIKILDEKNPKKIIMHCYSSSLEIARELVKKNIKLGIGGVLTFKNAQTLKEIVKNIDIKHLLLETDSPYLSPTPFRGEQNKPSNCYYIAKEIADIKGLTIEEVFKITTDNAIDQFDLPL